MEKPYEVKYHKLEKNYWWFKSRRDILLELIINSGKNSKILDIGCSRGELIKELNNVGFKNTYGIDKSEKAIKLCKKQNLKKVFIRGGTKTKFKNKEFDIIIASDILEHIKNDNLALTEWNRILKPNGKIIIFVPAFKFLFGKHDRLNQHYKRYGKKELVEQLQDSNFNIERISYWNCISFIPKIISKNKDQLYEINEKINKTLIYSLKFENLLLKKINLPIGTSLFTIAKKVKT